MSQAAHVAPVVPPVTPSASSLHFVPVRWIAVGPGGRLARQGCRANAAGSSPAVGTECRPPWSAPALRCARQAAGFASAAEDGGSAIPLPLVGLRLRSLRSLRPGPYGPALAGTALLAPTEQGEPDARSPQTRPRAAALLSCVVRSA